MPNHFLAINNPGGEPLTAVGLGARRTELRNESIGARALQDVLDTNFVNFQDADPQAFQFANQRASRASAIKQLGIQRKKLLFQQKTGLRDIGQARAKGLKGAINDALQRGIFNSGIRIENEAEVNREADEAVSDTKANLQFALDDLSARRQGLSAQRFGNPNTIQSGQISEADAVSLAESRAAKEISELDDTANQPAAPTGGIVQVPRMTGGITQT